MTLTRRAVAVPLVALIVLAQLLFLAVPGYALDPTKAGPAVTLGRTSKLFPKFFGPAGLAISIGILGYEGYQWAVAEGHLDNGSGDPITTRTLQINAEHTMLAQFDGSLWYYTGTAPTASATQKSLFVSESSGDRWYDEQPAGSSHSISTSSTLGPGLVYLKRCRCWWADDWLNVSGWAASDWITTADQPNVQNITTQRSTRLRATTTDQYGITTDHEVFGDPYPADSTVIPSPSFVPPPGEWMTSLELDTIPDDGAGTPERIYEWESEPDLEASYADCLPGGAAYPCDFGVQRLTETETDPEWQDCDELSGNCFNWWTHAQRALRFRCLWGPYVLPNSQCLQLARTYDTGTPWQGTTATNPELVPETQPQLVPTTTYPSTATQPGITIDPNTGEPITGTGTGTGTTPETGQPPVAQPGTADGCLATELVAFNPVTWVYAPVKCVFIWAFVPTQTQTQWAQLRTEASTRPPFIATTTAVPFLTSAVDGWSGGGCASALANFTPQGFGLSHLEAEIPCDPQIDGMAVVRAVQSFAVVGAGAFAMWRIYSSAVET